MFVQGFSVEEYGPLLWSILTGTFIFLVANAYVIYCASRRRNWARVVLLVLALLFVASVLLSLVMWPAEWDAEDLWSSATSGAYAIMEIIAMYWLFTGAGAKWYAEKEA